jgi:hypothetical protein
VIAQTQTSVTRPAANTGETYPDRG